MNSFRKIRTLRILCNNECNLSCFYCCSEGHKSDFNHLNSSNIRSIINNTNTYFDIERIKLTGGEPLCSPDIVSIIDAIYQTKKINQSVSIVTNGTKTDTLNKLLKHKDLDITISLPSLKPEVFGIITRGEQKLKNVLNSIELLNKNNHYIKLNCVLVESLTNTYENISEIVEEYGSHHNIEIRFLELCVNDSNKDLFEYENYKTNLDNFVQNMTNLGFSMAEATNKTESALYYKDGIRVKLIKFFCHKSCETCPTDKTSLWISCDGNITDCSYRYDHAISIENFANQNITRGLDKLFKSKRYIQEDLL